MDIDETGRGRLRGVYTGVKLVIGTRGSDLALWQAEHVRDLLQEGCGDSQVEIRDIETLGDRRSSGGIPSDDTGIFTSAIEEALLDGAVDVAVHSLKDLPTDTPEELTVAAVPPRGEAADVLVSPDGCSSEDLQEGAVVLTGSPRRRAQLCAMRPDLQVRPVAGNVPTRVEKMQSSGASGVVLAAAGLRRLGIAEDMAYRMDPVRFVPSPGQGALAVQVRKDDAEVREMCRAVDDPRSHLAVTAERVLLAELGAGCSVPAGGYACFGAHGEQLELVGMVGSPEGEPLLRERTVGPAGDRKQAERRGREMARRLCDLGAIDILEEFRANREDN